jgi:general secretion pathway protein J
MVVKGRLKNVTVTPFPRRRESMNKEHQWISACAGMTRVIHQRVFQLFVVRPNRRGRTDQGFTLLEILVAILIFAVVMSSLFVSFHSLMFEPAGIQQQFSRVEMGRSALDRIVSDLQAVYAAQPPQYRRPENGSPPDPYRLEAEADRVGNRQFSRLQFASLAHLPMRNRAQKGVARIVYYVQAQGDEDFVLRRADDLEPYPSLADSREDPVLCNHVRSLTFRFFNGEGDGFETWNSEEERFDYQLPASVAVRIELAAETEGRPEVFQTRVSLPVQRQKRG